MARGGVAATELTEAARRRGLRALLVLTFFTWGGFFVVVPLVSVHYVDGLGWAAGAVGVVLAARQFTQQGVTVASGVLADRIGAKRPIAAGMLLRAAGFAAMAFADSYELLLGAMLLAALGGALFESPKAAAIAALAPEAARARFYAQAGVASGLGITLGTQAGALLIRADFALLSVVGAACYGLMFGLVVWALPDVRVAQGEAGALHGLRLALRDRPFLVYLALVAGQWFMSTQFFLTLPLAADAVAGPEAIAAVFAVNSAVSLLLAYPLPRLAGRWLTPAGSLALGVAVTAAGILGIGFAGGLAPLLLAVLVFSVGTVVVRPSEQTVAAGLANPAALGSYFGVASLSVAVGGGFGNVAGGLLYDFGVRRGQPALPWAVFALVGFLAAAGLAVALRPHGLRVPGPAAGD